MTELRSNDRKFHGGKLVVLAIVAIVTFAAGDIPLWEFIDAQDGTYPTTGTVVCSHCHLGSGSPLTRGSGGTSIIFRLHDGTEHQTIWRAWFPPSKGDTIHVARDPVDPENNWVSRGSHGWLHAIRGIVVILLGLTAIVWLLFPSWFASRVHRKNHSQG